MRSPPHRSAATPAVHSATSGYDAIGAWASAASKRRCRRRRPHRWLRALPFGEIGCIAGSGGRSPVAVAVAVAVYAVGGCRTPVYITATSNKTFRTSVRCVSIAMIGAPASAGPLGGIASRTTPNATPRTTCIRRRPGFWRSHSAGSPRGGFRTTGTNQRHRPFPGLRWLESISSTLGPGAAGGRAVCRPCWKPTRRTRHQRMEDAGLGFFVSTSPPTHRHHQFAGAPVGKRGPDPRRQPQQSVVALITPKVGEGWHNNNHFSRAAPRVSRWEIDDYYGLRPWPCCAGPDLKRTGLVRRKRGTAMRIASRIGIEGLSSEWLLPGP